MKIVKLPNSQITAIFTSLDKDSIDDAAVIAKIGADAVNFLSHRIIRSMNEDLNKIMLSLNHLSSLHEVYKKMFCGINLLEELDVLCLMLNYRDKTIVLY